MHATKSGLSFTMKVSNTSRVAVKRMSGLRVVAFLMPVEQKVSSLQIDSIIVDEEEEDNENYDEYDEFNEDDINSFK